MAQTTSNDAVGNGSVLLVHEVHPVADQLAGGLDVVLLEIAAGPGAAPLAQEVRGEPGTAPDLQALPSFDRRQVIEQRLHRLLLLEGATEQLDLPRLGQRPPPLTMPGRRSADSRPGCAGSHPASPHAGIQSSACRRPRGIELRVAPEEIHPPAVDRRIHLQRPARHPPRPPPSRASARAAASAPSSCCPSPAPPSAISSRRVQGSRPREDEALAEGLVALAGAEEAGDDVVDVDHVPASGPVAEEAGTSPRSRP